MKPETIAVLLSILGFSSLESVNGKVSLSKEDVDKLNAEHLKKFGAELVLEGISFDKDDSAEFNESEILAIEAALAKEATVEEETTTVETDAEKVQLRKEVKELAKKVKTMEANQKAAQKTIIKLGQKPEEDLTPEAIKDGAKTIQHSKTHLFASGNEWDALTNDRPWNMRVVGKAKPSSEYTPIDIAKLNSDLGAYFRENKMEMISFLRAKKRLPAFWNVVSGVQDEIAYAKAFTGEVTQARKNKWLPKGNFEFQPEKAQVFAVQIDVELAGYELQSLETSWMNNLPSISSSGSQPYKMSFVAILAQEILKKASEEDEIGHIRGIRTVDDPNKTVAGLAIHKQNGLLKHIKDAQERLVYKTFDMGVPTAENIVDYVDSMIMRIPEYWRDLPNMAFYMGNYWQDLYKKRRETLYGLMPTYKEDVVTAKGHENIEIVGLPYMNESPFMFITTKDNISILENVEKEKEWLTIEKSKRDMAIIADYKIGIHVWAFGYEYDTAAEMTYDKQMFFSNDMYILEDLYLPIAVNDTTPSVATHTSLQTGVNTQATAITTFDDAVAGQYIFVKGNTGAFASTIADAGEFDLSAAVTLDENTLILLYARDVADFVEIQRWDLALSNVVFLAAGATTADADLGKHFVTAANSGATAFTNITNAVAGDVYLIEGGSSTNATTIAASGYFSRITAAITLNAGVWLKVKYNGEKFVELERGT